MEAAELIAYLTPVIVFLVAQIVKLIKQHIAGTIIVFVIVPVLSLGYTFLSQAISPDLPFLLQFLYGFAAIAIFELMKKLKLVE